MTKIEPTEEDIRNAADKWVGQKDRETSIDDLIYFRNNWQALPGLRACVTVETLTRRLAEVTAERDMAKKDIADARRATDHYLSSWRDASRYVTRLTEQAEAAERKIEALQIMVHGLETERDDAWLARDVLRSALRPFAEFGRPMLPTGSPAKGVWATGPDDVPVRLIGEMHFTFGMFRAAARAMDLTNDDAANSSGD